MLLVLAVPGPVRAQTEPGPPGPYVVDVRGAMIAIPNAGEFYPALPPATTIPGRGFGLDVGGHLLGPTLGAARIGIGANVLVARGQVGPPDVSARLVALAPQVSFNFGTADGWSYLGAGYGLGRISTRVAEPEETTLETGTVGTVNFGGGARWFVNRHAAVAFDVRFYRFGAAGASGTPATTRVALSVGLSVR